MGEVGQKKERASWTAKGEHTTSGEKKIKREGTKQDHTTHAASPEGMQEGGMRARKGEGARRRG